MNPETDLCAVGAGRPPVIALLGAVKAQFTREFEQRMSHTAYADVTLAHSANVLRWLHTGPVRTADLVARCEVSKQAISQQLHQLEERGYVATSPDPDDARARRVELTARGRACQRRVHAIFAEIEAEWADQLGTTAYGTLTDALSDIAGLRTTAAR